MIIRFEKTVTGLITVAEILDDEFGMPLRRHGESRAGESLDKIPQTRWKHPLTRVEYRFRRGKLYQMQIQEEEIAWKTSEDTDPDILISS